MQKEELINLLEDKHKNLFNWLEHQPEEKWEQGPDGKWTTGQHVLHLVDSMKKLNSALSLPKFLLRYKFGKSNRDVRGYDDVVNKYLDKLSKNQEKAAKFNGYIKIPKLEERQGLLTTLDVEQKKLQRTTKRWKDKHLDTLILPHPLLGRMPIREMIMFMGYHTEHHAMSLKERY